MADQELQSKGTSEVCEAHVERRWSDAGVATVEYAMVTVAAAAFAGVLAVLVRSDEVRDLLAGVIRGAFGG